MTFASVTSNVCSFASDGASVLSGSESGVPVQLVHLWNVYMLVCHCIAHRHALTVLEASKNNDVAEFVNVGLHGIVNYFSHYQTSLSLENIARAVTGGHTHCVWYGVHDMTIQGIVSAAYSQDISPVV